MLDEAISRTRTLQARMAELGIRHAVFTSESAIAYLAGFWGYLGIEFGRPTLLVVSSDSDPIVITPLMESELVGQMTWVEDIRSWEDAGQRSWARALREVLPEMPEAIWVEALELPARVRMFFDDQYPGVPLRDIGPILGAQRMIKSPLEIDVMRQTGAIAGAMMQAAHASLHVGGREYESALAVIAAGTRKAAGFLTNRGWERFVSPMIHNLQILQSGKNTSMVHGRASVKAYERGNPVYFCFCNMAQFKQYKLGFDRMFHVAEASDEAVRVQQAAIDAQQSALKAIRPGVQAQDVAAAADEIYAERGYATGYRTGRSIGVAYLEAPELKAGDQTILKSGMTFAVDGGISVEGETAGRIGDSIVVTETGFDYLTDYPREVMVTDA